MNKENIINIIESISNIEKEEQEYFDKKLIELIDYQDKTEKTLNRFRNEFFPDIILKNIVKYCPNNENQFTFYCGNKTVKMFHCGDELNFIFIEDSFKITIYSKNSFDKAYDWWSKPDYRESHLIRRFKRLDEINYFCNFIEENIADVYNALAKKIQEEKLKEKEKTIKNIESLEKQKCNESDKKIIKITIEMLN